MAWCRQISSASTATSSRGRSISREVVAMVRRIIPRPKSKPTTISNTSSQVISLDDQVGPAQLQTARIQAPDAQALLARVQVRPDERFTARYPKELNARITIH